MPHSMPNKSSGPHPKTRPKSVHVLTLTLTASVKPLLSLSQWTRVASFCFSCLCSSPFHYSSPSRVIICLATACFKSSDFLSSAEKSQLLTQVDKMSAYSGVCLHL